MRWEERKRWLLSSQSRRALQRIGLRAANEIYDCKVVVCVAPAMSRASKVVGFVSPGARPEQMSRFLLNETKLNFVNIFLLKWK